MQTTAERTWGSDRAAATFAERTLPTSPYAHSQILTERLIKVICLLSILKL